MIHKSTIQLLRFHFSFFLMPVYWFALSQTTGINITRAIIIFIIFHVLIYPASNGYNSYMDRDTGSIGGIKKPMQPTKQLFYTSVAFDIIAILASTLISVYFLLAVILYILASRAYSYRGIRLKKYPVTGYITVIIFQGAVTYFAVVHGTGIDKPLNVSFTGMTIATLLIGGFYPLTQVYQHKQDKEDGTITISMLLGYKGTFIFTAVIYLFAMSILSYQLLSAGEQKKLFIILLFFLPVLIYFSWWFKKVLDNHEAANFVNTMRMNLLASTCTNAAFITLLLIEKF
ncbi:MAG: UbiA family prenyltransferase [Ferruginibacter sp.]